jgi:hypothetical protein
MISRVCGNRFLFQLVWKTLRYGLMGRSGHEPGERRFFNGVLTAPDGINRLCALYSGLSKQNSPPSSYIHYIGESPNALPAVRCVPYVQTIDVAQSRYDNAPREQ